MKNCESKSRRDFLVLSSLGVAGGTLPLAGPSQAGQAPMQAVWSETVEHARLSRGYYNMLPIQPGSLNVVPGEGVDLREPLYPIIKGGALGLGVKNTQKEALPVRMTRITNFHETTSKEEEASFLTAY